MLLLLLLLLLFVHAGAPDPASLLTRLTSELAKRPTNQSDSDDDDDDVGRAYRVQTKLPPMSPSRTKRLSLPASAAAQPSTAPVGAAGTISAYGFAPVSSPKLDKLAAPKSRTRHILPSLAKTRPTPSAMMDAPSKRAPVRAPKRAPRKPKPAPIPVAHVAVADAVAATPPPHPGAEAPSSPAAPAAEPDVVQPRAAAGVAEEIQAAAEHTAAAAAESSQPDTSTSASEAAADTAPAPVLSHALGFNTGSDCALVQLKLSAAGDVAVTAWMQRRQEFHDAVLPWQFAKWVMPTGRAAAFKLLAKTCFLPMYEAGHSAGLAALRRVGQCDDALAGFMLPKVASRGVVLSSSRRLMVSADIVVVCSPTTARGFLVTHGVVFPESTPVLGVTELPRTSPADAAAAVGTALTKATVSDTGDVTLPDPRVWLW